MLAIAVRDPGPAVRHPDLDLALRWHHLACDGDGALLRSELERVSQQVAEDLAHAGRVAVGAELGLVDAVHQPDALPLGLRRDDRERVAYDLAQIAVASIEDQPARVEPRQIEQVAEQTI